MFTRKRRKGKKKLRGKCIVCSFAHPFCCLFKTWSNVTQAGLIHCEVQCDLDLPSSFLELPVCAVPRIEPGLCVC